MDARRTAGLNNAPYCMWSPTPPLELKGAPDDALSVNAGFITFGNFKEMGSLFLLFFLIVIICTVYQCSYFTSSCGRQETGSDSVEFINFPCICQLSC